MPVSGIEIPCIYFFYGVKARKRSVCEKTKQYEKDLMFQTTRVFTLRK